MPFIGPYHPYIVHFVIAFLFLGVVFRLVSLTRRLGFTGPAALTLLLLGTAASVGAVRSGQDAHGPVERVPGAREAVERHQDWGEWTRNVFLAVAALELVALGLVRWPAAARPVLLASAALGLAGLVCLYQAAARGGDLVYSHAGGVGIRSGDPADVGRLLMAGLYHQAQADRRAGRPQEAADMIDTASRRFGSDLEVQLLAAESLLLDRKDPAGALAALGRLRMPPDRPPLRLRHGLLTVEALVAAGQTDGARAALQSLRPEFPDSQVIQRRLQELGGR